MLSCFKTLFGSKRRNLSKDEGDQTSRTECIQATSLPGTVQHDPRSTNHDQSSYKTLPKTAEHRSSRDRTTPHRSEDLSPHGINRKALSTPATETLDDQERPLSYQDGTTGIDYSETHRSPVVQENIHPHVHTIYEPEVTRSLHVHEHRTVIQPIIDPEPNVLPEQHWLQDSESGKMVPVSTQVGNMLSQDDATTTTHVRV